MAKAGLQMRANDIEVFMVGSPVIVGGKIEAVITGICIREHRHITYECSWFDNANRHCQWLEQIEIKRHEKSATTRIGFQ